MTNEIPSEAAGADADPGWEEDIGLGDEAPVDPSHPALRPDVANQARIYDYWLGGKDNFEVDRRAGDAVAKTYPDIVYLARANRAFLRRVVRFLAGEAGIRQFLDIGTGIPAAGNTHEVAQELAPASRVVYVDYDPVVLSYAHALLRSGPQGATDYIDADLRDPAAILGKAARTLDFSHPVAVSLLAILHAISDGDDPYGIVATIMEAMPSGSYLAISHPAADIEEEKVAQAMNDASALSHRQFTPRSHAEILRFFSGLEMLEPGLVQVHHWRPDLETGRTIAQWGGVGRKP